MVEKQEDGFYRILGIYACCFAVALPIRVSQIFFTYKLGIIWREWLSKSLVKDYMTNKAYYQLNPNDEEQTDVDNPIKESQMIPELLPGKVFLSH